MLLRVCREFGCLPQEIEALSAQEFCELAAYLIICDRAEKEAIEKARVEAEAKSKSRRR